MSVRLIVEISVGVAAAAIAGAIWFWKQGIVENIARIWKRLADSCSGVSFFKILETFLNEAAVLWFVFPLLNKVFPEVNSQAKSEPSTTNWSGIGRIGISWLAAFMLFIGASVIGKVAENLEDEKERLERETRG